MARDNLWQLTQLAEGLAFQCPLRAEYQIVLASSRIERWFYQIACGANLDRRAHDDHIAALEVLGNFSHDIADHVDANVAFGVERRPDGNYKYAGV